MKQLSIWAYQNRTKSRWLMILLGFILGTLGSFVGILLEDMGIILPFDTMHYLTAAFIVTYLFYPIRNYKKGLWKESYARRKSFDAVMTVLGFFMWVAFANIPITHDFDGQELLFTEKTTPSVKTAEAAVSLPNSENTKGAIGKFKSMRREMWTQLREIKTYYRTSILKSDPDAVKRAQWGWILIILLSLAIAYLAAALACSASCSGNNVLAFLILLLGLGLIVALFTFQIRKIKRLRKAAT